MLLPAMMLLMYMRAPTHENKYIFSTRTVRQFVVRASRHIARNIECDGLTTTSIGLHAQEDQIADSEQSHTTTQVAYIVFE